MIEPDVALVEMIEQPAGSGDDDIHARVESADLRAGGDAAENHGGGQPKSTAVDAEAVIDLARQFTGGRQHEHAARAARGSPAIVGQPLEDRQRESCGLAGAGLSDPHEVATGEDVWDRLRLDWRRRRVSLGGQHLEDGGSEA